MATRTSPRVIDLTDPAPWVVDVAVVGAGPAGLAAAATLAGRGAGVVVFEREDEPGGIPRLNGYPGHGWRDQYRPVDGPTYARHLVDRAERAGAEIRIAATVTGWAGDRTIRVAEPAGVAEVRARALVLATGCRERPLSASPVPGIDRAGVFTTGSLLRWVHDRGGPVGRTAVIVGGGQAGLAAAHALRRAGCGVAAFVTDQPRHLAPALLRRAVAGGGVPLLTGVTVARVEGDERVTALVLSNQRRIPCDTVVITGDWVPDHELARTGGLGMDPGTRGPRVDAALRTSAPGVFAAGNVVRAADTAEACAVEGRHLASAAEAWLDGTGRWPAVETPIEAVAPLGWVSPNVLRPGALRAPGGHLVVHAAQAVAGHPVLSLVQGDRLLWAGKARGPLIPGRRALVPDTGLGAADPSGPPVRLLVGDLR